MRQLNWKTSENCIERETFNEPIAQIGLAKIGCLDRSPDLEKKKNRFSSGETNVLVQHSSVGQTKTCGANLVRSTTTQIAFVKILLSVGQSLGSRLDLPQGVKFNPVPDPRLYVQIMVPEADLGIAPSATVEQFRTIGANP